MLDNSSRISSIQSMLEKIDRIVFDSNVTVDMAADSVSGSVPCYSQEYSIYLNWDLLGLPKNLEEMAGVLGANYHELCHVMYTPGTENAYVNRIRNEGLFNTYNLLEDQRIENLFVAKYESSRMYFTVMTLKYVVTVPTSTAHCFLYGRRYLKPSLRKVVHDMYLKDNGKVLLDKCNSIIDEYIGLVLPRDMQRAYELVKKFYTEVTVADNLFGHQTRMYTGSQQQKDQMDHSEKVMSGDVEPSDEDSGDGGDAKTLEGEGAGNGTSSDNDGASSGKQRGGSVGSKKKPQAPSSEQVIDKIKDSLNEALRDGNLQDESGRYLEYSNSYRNLKSESGKLILANGAMKRLASTIARELKITDDVDPGWRREQNSGRLNIPHYLREYNDPNVFDTGFDQWDEGIEDASSVEVCLLVDISSSMYKMLDEVLQGAWSIARGVQIAHPKNKVHVFGYGSDSFVFYGEKDTISQTSYKSFRTSGSTNPIRALIWTSDCFRTSKCASKVAIILTDGMFDGLVQANTIYTPYFNNIRKHGGTTTMFVMGNYYQMVPQYGQDAMYPIANASGLVDGVRNIVKAATRSSYRTAKAKGR